MPKVKVYNTKNEEVGSLTLKPEIWENEYNEALIHEVVVAHLANQRQGTKSALTRSEVRGHAKKPWRQKHTGRARHGSTKAPQWTGGGVAFAPKPRDFSKKVNKQAKRVAFLSALSKKLEQKEIVVLDNVNIEAPKTKFMQEVMDNFKLTKNVILVTENKNDTVVRASGNIQNLLVTTAEQLNTYEVVSNRVVLFTKDAIKQIEEAYAK